MSATWVRAQALGQPLTLTVIGTSRSGNRCSSSAIRSARALLGLDDRELAELDAGAGHRLAAPVRRPGRQPDPVERGDQAARPGPASTSSTRSFWYGVVRTRASRAPRRSRRAGSASCRRHGPTVGAPPTKNRPSFCAVIQLGAGVARRAGVGRRDRARPGAPERSPGRARALARAPREARSHAAARRRPPGSSLRHDARRPPSHPVAGGRAVRGDQGRRGDRCRAHHRPAHRGLADRAVADPVQGPRRVAAPQCRRGRRTPARARGGGRGAGGCGRGADHDPRLHYRRDRSSACAGPEPCPGPRSPHPQLPEPRGGRRHPVLPRAAIALRVDSTATDLDRPQLHG